MHGLPSAGRFLRKHGLCETIFVRPQAADQLLGTVIAFIVAERRNVVESGRAAFGKAGGDSRHWAAAGVHKEDGELGTLVAFQNSSRLRFGNASPDYSGFSSPVFLPGPNSAFTPKPPPR